MLNKLLPREEKFFDMLEASAGEVRASAGLLSRLLEGLDAGAAAGSLNGFTEHRRKDKQITQQITEALCRTFVTPIDRDDIVELAAALYKIPKTIERIGERLLAYRLKPWRGDFHRQNELLNQATEALVFMVGDLRHLKNPDAVRVKHAELQRLEGEGDKLMLELTHQLFAEQADVKEVLMRKDIYELLEKALDRFRDAGNVVLQVVMKHS